MSRSMDRFVAILALWKLEIPYVLVEKCLPRNRIKIMIRQTKPSCILFDSELEEVVNTVEFFAETVLVKFEELWQLANKLEQVDIPLKGTEDEDTQVVACILYTSGSTGVPKGVQLTHSNIMYRLNWQWRELPSKSNEVGLAKTSLLFVDSITESWSFLLQGKPVVVATQEAVHNPKVLVDTLGKFAVTRLLVVPSLLQSLLTYLKISSSVKELDSLRMVFSSGESLPAILARSFFSIFTRNKWLINLYGSTEFTGDGTFELFENIDDVENRTFEGALSIGKPIDNITIKLVNGDSNEASDGAVGEIWVEGPTVMTGYVNIEHNKNAFFSDEQGTWYRTGDFATVIKGALIYKGRHDNQIKIRGSRVNTAEIEKVIQTIEDVKTVVILMVGDNIVAFCEAKETLTEQDIKQQCSEFLPEYMVPRVCLLEKIPHSPTNEKVDNVELRKLFKQRNVQLYGNVTDEETTSQIHKIREVIANVIGIESIEQHDNFYENGGNSINVVQIADRLEELGIKIDFQGFVRARTVKEMIDCTEPTVEDSKSLMNQFRREPFDHNTSRHDVAAIASEALANHELVCRSSNSSVDEWYTIFKNRIWEAASDSGVSATYYRNSEPVAVTVSFDAAAGLDFGGDISPELKLILEIVEFTEKDAKETLEKPILDNFLTGVAPMLSGEEKLALMDDMENYTVEKTMAARLGWETLMTLDLRDYVRPDGTKPFRTIPQDSIIKTMFKRL